MNLQDVGLAFEHTIAIWMPEVLKKGQFSYIITQLRDNQAMKILAQRDIDRVHAGASMVKVLIMAYLFERARLGDLNVYDTVALADVPRVEGGGALQELGNHHRFTYLELCRLMMVLSDNWATNLLLHHLGMNAINEFANHMGFYPFSIQRYMMDTEAMRQGRENEITALSMAHLYNHLYQMRNEEPYGAEMWRILGRQQFRDKIPFYWGEEVPFYHKTGVLDRVEHDGGVYINPYGAFCIVAFVSQVDNGDAIFASAEFGRRVRDFLDHDVALAFDSSNKSAVYAGADDI